MDSKDCLHGHFTLHDHLWWWQLAYTVCLCHLWLDGS